MPGAKPETIDIAELIGRSGVVTHFQPIISLKDKKVVGTEALSRGTSSVSKSLISPLSLIEAAAEKHLDLELDRLFRKTALETYQKVDPAAVIPLFLNVNPKILDSSDLELG